MASWYTSATADSLTANGEVFDPTTLSAAHKTLKFGTLVRVEDTKTGRSVEVRINDRGPFIQGRIIDLTPAAAKILGIYELGIAPVSLEVLYEPLVPESKYNRPGDTGWYLLQLGAFSNMSTVLRHYQRLTALGFKLKIAIVNRSLVRISVRWIPKDELERTLAVLKGLGFTEVLKLSEENPYLSQATRIPGTM
jgi:rare lipoprotein A